MVIFTIVKIGTLVKSALETYKQEKYLMKKTEKCLQKYYNSLPTNSKGNKCVQMYSVCHQML